MGFGTLRQIVQVELPLAVPVIIAGLRVATVSSISLVTVGQLIGIGGLGYFFTDGEQRDFPTEIYVALILIVILAFLADTVLVLLRRWLTPWEAGRSARARQPRSQPHLAGFSCRGRRMNGRAGGRAMSCRAGGCAMSCRAGGAR